MEIGYRLVMGPPPLGDAVLTALLGTIRRDAPPGAWVNLLADAPGRRLYERQGFTETAPGSLGMALPLGDGTVER